MSSYSNTFLKILDDLSVKVDKLQARLKVDVAGIECREIKVNVGRAVTLKKYVEKLTEENNKLTSQYWQYYRRLVRYVRARNIITKISIYLIIAIASIMIALILLIVAPSSPLADLLPLLPVIVAVGGSSMVIVVVLNIILWITVIRDYDARKDYEVAVKLWNSIKSTRDRLKVLIKEFRRSEKYLRFFKKYNFCKCYEEFTEFAKVFKEFVKSLKNLSRCSDLECRVKSISVCRDTLVKLKKMSPVCKTIHTEEYSSHIDYKPVLLNKIDQLIKELRRNGKPSIDMRDGEVEIRIGYRTIEINLLEYVLNNISASSEPSSPYRSP